MNPREIAKARESFDAQMAYCRAVAETMAGSVYDLGLAFGTLWETYQAWCKARGVRASVGSEYTKRHREPETYAAWIATELQMSMKHVMTLQRIAVNFSREECVALGYGRLVVVLAAPDAGMRERLIRMAREGATRKELRAEVSKARASLGYKPRGKHSEIAKHRVAFDAADGPTYAKVLGLAEKLPNAEQLRLARELSARFGFKVERDLRKTAPKAAKKEAA